MPTIPPGISVFAGILYIGAPKPSGNTVVVEMSGNGILKVTLNGQTQEFDRPAMGLWTIGYVGAAGGGDSFTNNTDLTETLQMHGGHNVVVGGGTWNMVNLHGDNNTYDAKNVPSYVFSFEGPNDNITPYPNVFVTHYGTDPDDGG